MEHFGWALRLVFGARGVEIALPIAAIDSSQGVASIQLGTNLPTFLSTSFHGLHPGVAAMKLQEYLACRHVDFDVLRHDETFDSQHLAESVHISGRKVAKTVLLRMDHGYQYAVAILPATHLIDLDAVGQILGGARMELATEYEIAQRCPDCEMGVLPPFGSMYGLETLLDESLRNVSQIVFEGNTHHEAIRMAGEDFTRLESPIIGSFARLRKNEHIDARNSKHH